LNRTTIGTGVGFLASNRAGYIKNGYTNLSSSGYQRRNEHSADQRDVGYRYSGGDHRNAYPETRRRDPCYGNSSSSYEERKRESYHRNEGKGLSDSYESNQDSSPDSAAAGQQHGIDDHRRNSSDRSAAAMPVQASSSDFASN